MSGPAVARGEVWWVSLDPTQGSEIRKTRPCVVLTHDTLNRLRRTVVVIPLSATARPHPPITVPVTCQGQPAVAAIDQIRAVAKHRLKSKVETMTRSDLDTIGRAISTILEIR
ncbi:MAG: PemK family transcriptional regulator [Lentisphaerae bacterium RIFOXYB12_FULL_65_16]|nr:MAG: PemK family transcriptional regulator [Lentisphaerae bacterium RIFOXYB12_FULL_65_16]OGV95341.1 MAG: PemK family transcriptional regulator [Lentisphaerae bacterium RIFOXYB12_FULL_65_16]